MVVPLAARIVAAVVGGVLVVSAARSMIATIIVPRPARGWLTRLVDWLVKGGFHVATVRIRKYERLDRVLAAQAPVILLVQLIAWLVIFYLGYSLLIWPFVHAGITKAFNTAGPALWFIGNSHVSGAGERAIQDIASVTGLVTITLQIAYLPTLYSAFNRRETDLSLLNARAGVPSWGPELLARTHYALGSGASTIDTLPDLYAQWERFAADITESHTTYLPLVRFRSPRRYTSWVIGLLAVLDSAAMYLARTHYALGSGASTIDTLPDLYAQWERFAADITESHTTYLPLVRFRSPRRYTSWVTGLLAVLDSAAMYLAVSPESAPAVPARLCLRSGFICLSEIAAAMGMKIPEADPDAEIGLTYEKFLEAVDRLHQVDFPIEREAEQAWPDFVGWRVNYEQAAYAIAYEIEAVPARWSGPRRRPYPEIAPLRPPPGRQPKDKLLKKKVAR